MLCELWQLYVKKSCFIDAGRNCQKFPHLYLVIYLGLRLRPGRPTRNKPPSRKQDRKCRYAVRYGQAEFVPLSMCLKQLYNEISYCCIVLNRIINIAFMIIVSSNIQVVDMIVVDVVCMTATSKSRPRLLLLHHFSQ